MKKVASIVLNNFTHDSRVLKEAVSLQETGLYDVTVIALHEEGLLEQEKINDVNVHRINLITKKWPKKAIFQLIKYIEFAVKFFINYRKIDIVHCNDLGPLPIVCLYKIILNRNVSIIYDAHELETETNALKGLRKRLAKCTEWLFIRHVDDMITVSNSIAKEYEKSYQIKRPNLVLNCPKYRVTKKKNKFHETFNINEDTVIFLYQGALLPGRGIEEVLSAFENHSNQKAKLVIMGYGALEDKVKNYMKKNENIFFHEAVPPEELLEYTASADVGICLIEDTCYSYRYSLPNKFFEYSMAGLPILASNLPEMRSLIEQYECGWIIKDRSNISEKINEVVNSDISCYTSNSREMAKKYCWEEQEKILIKTFKDLSKIQP